MQSHNRHPHSACRRSPPHPRRRPTVTAALAPRLALAAAVATPALYAWWLRPLLAWGATPDETSAYPGDELIPDADHSTTMATTLPAPPERVWPWLVQMGLGRGGWYGWDWLDNHRAPSADRIVAQWQHLEEGQRLNSMPNGRNWMTVAALEPNRTLVLVDLPVALRPHRCDGAWSPPWAYTDAIWGFHLRPAAGGRRRPGLGPAPPATVDLAVQPAAGRAAALQHADAPVPQPAHSGRPAAVRVGRGGGRHPWARSAAGITLTIVVAVGAAVTVLFWVP